MKSLKIFLLVLITLMVIFCGWLFLIAMSVEKALFNPDFYRELLHETDLTSVVYLEIEESLPQILLAEVEGDVIEITSREEEQLLKITLNLMTQLFIQAFDQEWLEEQLLLIIDDLIAFFKNEQRSLTAVVDISERKQTLINSVTALQERGTTLLWQNLDIPLDYFDELYRNLDIPDELVMAEVLDDHVKNIDREKVASLQNMTSWFYYYLGYLAFALFLLLSCLLAGFGGGLKWFGAGTVFYSLTFLICMQLTETIISPVLVSSLSNDFIFLPNLVEMIIRYTLGVVSIVPMIFTAIGLGLIVIGVISGKMLTKEEQ